MSTNLPPFAEIRRRFTMQNRFVKKHVLNPVTLTGYFRYGTSPMHTGGAICCFDSLADLYSFLVQLEDKRFEIRFTLVDGVIQ